MTDNPFRALLQDLGVKQIDLYRRWGIPLRTVSHWMAGDRPCPDYIINMLRELLKEAEGN